MKIEAQKKTRLPLFHMALLCGLILLFGSACDDESGGIPISGEASPTTTTTPNPGTDSPPPETTISEDEEDPSPSLEDDETETPAVIYRFSKRSGKCLNEAGDLGFNLGHEGECGDMRGKTIENSLESDQTLWGLRLQDSKLLSQTMNIHHMAESEVFVDKKTEFPLEIPHPHTSFFLGHANAHRKFKTTAGDHYNAYKNAAAEVRALRSQYNKAKKLPNPEEERARLMVLIEEKIAYQKEQHDLFKTKRNQSNRQSHFLNRTYKRAQKEEAFQKKELSNEKNLDLSDELSFVYKASDKVFSHSKRFTISLWFKTETNQNDKRLINFHRGSEAGSALNLSLKNGRVVMGLWIAGDYRSVEHPIDYDDGEWHHFAVTRQKDGLFELYFDGVLRTTYESTQETFSGFGSFPMMIGSYNGKDRYFTGLMDEVSLWQNTLQRNEIKEIYNGGVPGNLFLTKKVTHLRHWWSLGDHPSDTDISFSDHVSGETLNLYE